MASNAYGYKVIVSGTVSAATLQGLVANHYYAMTPTFTLIDIGTAVPGNPGVTSATLATAGVKEGNGIYFSPIPDFTMMAIHISTSGAQTSLAGGQFLLYPLIYPFQAGANTLGGGTPATAVPFIGFALTSTTIPLQPGAQVTMGAGAGVGISHAFMPLLFATAWPTVGSPLTVQIEAW